MGHTITLSLSKLAAADLRTHQFKFVNLDSTGKVVLADAAGEQCLGVLLNKPNTGEIATVAVAGVVPVKAGGVIAVGGAIKSGAAGTALAASAGVTNTSDAGAASDPLVGSYVMGMHVGAAASAANDVIDMLITREGVIPTTAA
jgi:hypothetical protein